MFQINPASRSSKRVQRPRGTWMLPVWLLVGGVSVTVFLLAAPAGAQDLGAPDVVYYNGKVVTVDDAFSIAEAVAISGGRIVAVGSDEEVAGLAASETRQVDLDGRTMLSGFYDNHVHVG